MFWQSSFLTIADVMDEWARVSDFLTTPLDQLELQVLTPVLLTCFSASGWLRVEEQ